MAFLGLKLFCQPAGDLLLKPSFFSDHSEYVMLYSAYVYFTHSSKTAKAILDSRYRNKKLHRHFRWTWWGYIYQILASGRKKIYPLKSAKGSWHYHNQEFSPLPIAQIWSAILHHFKSESAIIYDCQHKIIYPELSPFYGGDSCGDGKK